MEKEDVVPLGVVENGPGRSIAARVRLGVDDAFWSDGVDRGLEIVEIRLDSEKPRLCIRHGETSGQF